MSDSFKFEQSLLRHDEFEIVRVTHHPNIYDSTEKELRDLRTKLRKMRERERTLARQKRREVRGKAEPRGGSFPGTVEKPKQRKQIFSAALKRVNKEIRRQKVVEARASNVAAARRALAARRAQKFVHHPTADDTSREGFAPLPNRRRQWKVPPAKIGSISQATKVAQATRDSKN